MLFTTFLLTTAVGAAAVQGALLLKHKPDNVRARLPYGLIGVGAAIAGLVWLGLGMT
jgi:predicted acyltransferase